MEGGSNIDGDESGGVPAGCRHRNSGPPKLVGDGGGDRNRFWKKVLRYYEFPSRGLNIGQRGHREGPQGSQEGARRGLGWGHARDPSGVPVVSLPSFLGDFGGFRDADFLYNFSGIFGALLMAGKPKIQKQQKTAIGNWVH